MTVASHSLLGVGLVRREILPGPLRVRERERCAGSARPSLVIAMEMPFTADGGASPIARKIRQKAQSTVAVFAVSRRGRRAAEDQNKSARITFRGEYQRSRISSARRAPA